MSQNTVANSNELDSFALGQLVALGTLSILSTFLVAGGIAYLYYTLIESILLSKLPYGTLREISTFLFAAGASLFGMIASRVVLHRYAKEALLPVMKDAAAALK